VNDPESPRSPNGDYWTFTSLREYLLRIVSDLREHVLRIVADQDKAVQAALAASEKAVTKAEAQAENWRQSANEWRGAMTDRERSFVPRTEHVQAIQTLNEKIERLEKRDIATTSVRQGGDAVVAYVIAVGGIAIGAGGLALAVLK